MGGEGAVAEFVGASPAVGDVIIVVSFDLLLSHRSLPITAAILSFAVSSLPFPSYFTRFALPHPCRRAQMPPPAPADLSTSGIRSTAIAAEPGAGAVVSASAIFGTLSEPMYQGMDLLAAVQNGNMPLVYMLVRQGASVNRHDSRGYTALQWAALNNFLEIASFLLQNGARVDERSRDGEATTALMWAALRGHLQMAALLLQWGADIQAADTRGYSAIFHAVHYEQLWMLHFLLSRGADIAHRDAEGHPILHWAAYKNLFDIVEYLFDYRRVSVDDVCNLGRTALIWAAREGHASVCSLLLHRGALAGHADREGLTAQRHAIDKGHFRLNVAECERRDPRAMQQFEISGTQYLTREAIQIFILPIMAFACIALVHPLVGLATFVGAMMLFGRFANSWKTGTTRTPIHMAWWLGSVVSCLAVHVSILEPVVLQRGHSMADLLFWSLVAAMLGVYFKGSLTDPGIVHRNQDEYREMLDAIARGSPQDLGTDFSRFCYTCKTRKPVRSKHCRFSGYCVARYDHFCVWFNSAVGFRNHPFFFLYCWFHNVVDAIMIWFCVMYFESHLALFQDGSGLGSSAGADRVATVSRFYIYLFTKPPVLCVLLYNILVFLFTGTLAVQHTFFMLRNLTSNEMSDFTRYFPEGINVFDRGAAANTKEFWGLRGFFVDWRGVFERPSPSPAALAALGGAACCAHSSSSGDACAHASGGGSASASAAGTGLANGSDDGVGSSGTSSTGGVGGVGHGHGDALDLEAAAASKKDVAYSNHGHNASHAHYSSSSAGNDASSKFIDVD